MSDFNLTDNNIINIDNFKKIDSWNTDSYTGVIRVVYDDKRFRTVIEKDTEIQGVIKTGSYISIIRGDKATKINAVTVIPAGLFNKIKQAQNNNR